MIFLLGFMSIRLHVNIAPIWFCNICYSVAFSEKSEVKREDWVPHFVFLC